MRAKYVPIAAMAMMITMAGSSQARVKAIALNAGTPGAKTAANNLSGVWHGEYRDLPWVTVTLTQEGGAFSGAILFYLHRKTPGSAETATAGTPEPLLDLHSDGKTLTFRVSTRHTDPPRTLDDPSMAMTMEIIDQDHARLINKEDPHLSGLLTRLSH
jgi:hypothetical protein